jgi:hypothetical protein
MDGPMSPPRRKPRTDKDEKVRMTFWTTVELRDAFHEAAKAQYSDATKLLNQCMAEVVRKYEESK